MQKHDSPCFQHAHAATREARRLVALLKLKHLTAILEKIKCSACLRTFSTEEEKNDHTCAARDICSRCDTAYTHSVSVRHEQQCHVAEIGEHSGEIHNQNRSTLNKLYLQRTRAHTSAPSTATRRRTSAPASCLPRRIENLRRTRSWRQPNVATTRTSGAYCSPIERHAP